MVLPEGTPPIPDRSNTPRLVGLVVTAALVLLSILALGQATTPTTNIASPVITLPDPIVAPSTTTAASAESFSVADHAIGNGFSWMSGPLERTYPVDLVNHAGRVFLFGSDRALSLIHI